MKNILFVCGSGGITSAVAESYVVEACKSRGIQVKTRRCAPMEVDSNLDGMDIIVSTTVLKREFPIPLISGLPLITGIGKDKVIDEILEKINSN